MEQSTSHISYVCFMSCCSLAESLDMQPPVMPEDGTTRLTAGDEASSSTAVKDTSVPEPIWDDEDTKTFYECLPDLRSAQFYVHKEQEYAEMCSMQVAFRKHLTFIEESGLSSSVLRLLFCFLGFNCFCLMPCFSRAFVPAVLLGEAEPKSNEQSAKAKDKSSVSGWHTTLDSVILALLGYTSTLLLLQCENVYRIPF